MLRSLRTAFLVLCTSIIHLSGSIHVFVLHPLHSGSHEVQLRVLSSALAHRNHRITYVKFKNFVQLPPPEHPNITFTTLAVDNADGAIPFVTREKRGRFMLPLDILWEQGLNPWGVPFDAFRTITPFCDALLSDFDLRKRLEKDRPDVAIVDVFTNECGLALLDHLGIPALVYWALPLSGGEGLFSSGLSQPPGSSPAFLAQLTDEMNFFQRAKNLFFAVMGSVVMTLHFTITDRAIQRHLPGAPSSADLLANVSGVLENSDFALDFPRELPPNVINVGCMQCRNPQPLSQDLEDFMRGSGRSGVILFSMGATFDMTVAPPRLLRRLLHAFSRLPQRVLMKVGGAAPIPADIELPGNVRAERWLPQQDILGHPKTRIFFTHCGLHGALEGVWHGVPAVALPVFGDQGDVAEMLRVKGVAVRLGKDATAEEIYAALRTVLDDPRYRENAAKLRSVIRDQMVSPLERAVWFVEHVARQRGAPHLKLASRQMGLVRKFCLDVWAAFFLVLALLYWNRHRPIMWSRKMTANTLRRALYWGSATKSHKE